MGGGVRSEKKTTIKTGLIPSKCFKKDKIILGGLNWSKNNRDLWNKVPKNHQKKGGLIRILR